MKKLLLVVGLVVMVIEGDGTPESTTCYYEDL